MAIDFPNSPTAGDTYTVNGKTWSYTGSRWENVVTSLTKAVRNVSADTALASGDKNQIVRFTGSSAQTLTVNNVLSAGDSTSVFQDGTGAVNLTAGSGVTLMSPATFATRKQYSKVDINCVASGQYRLSGDLVTGATVTGGTLTSDSTYYYRTFTGNGTLLVENAGLAVDILVIAGGGSGGAGTGGGGGAGGLINISGYPLTASSYTVTIGAGGTNDSVDIGTSGVNTTVSNGARTLTALGGGYGGSSETGSPGPTFNAASGGSGGGAQGYYAGNTTPGSATQPSTTNDGVATYATTGFGNAGGSPNTIPQGHSGGGGGAGAAGANGTTGAGGAGLQLSISGTAQWYAAGGSGGANGTTSTNGIGGYHVSPSGTAGATNTGSGGGGGYGHADGFGGAGGSGIVIVRYLRTAVV
jgi:hypothetical protein